MHTLVLICDSRKEFERIFALGANAGKIVMKEIEESNEVPLLDFLKGKGNLNYSPYLLPDEVSDFVRDLKKATNRGKKVYIKRLTID